MSFTNYLETAVLGHVFGSTTMAKPASVHVALFTAAPGEAAGGTELSISGTAYARLAATFNVSGDLATNASALEWNVATSNWGTITHVAVFDASTGGNMLAYAPLTVSKTIGSGDVFRIPAGDLDITLN